MERFYFCSEARHNTCLQVFGTLADAPVRLSSTVRQMLSHTTGYGYFFNREENAWLVSTILRSSPVNC